MTGHTPAGMNPEQQLYFRDELRAARAAALRDSEDFACILYVIERLGAFLLHKVEDLGKHRSELIELN